MACIIIREHGSGPVSWWRDEKLAILAKADCEFPNPIIATRILPIGKMPGDRAHVALTERTHRGQLHDQIARSRSARDLDISVACPSQEGQTLKDLIESGKISQELEVRRVQFSSPEAAEISDALESDRAASTNARSEHALSNEEPGRSDNGNLSSPSRLSAEETEASADGEIDNAETETVQENEGPSEPANAPGTVATALSFDERISGAEPGDNAEVNQDRSLGLPRTADRSVEPSFPPPLSDQEIAFYVTNSKAANSMPRHLQGRPALPIHTHNVDRLIELACSHLRRQKRLFVLHGRLCKLRRKSRHRQGDAKVVCTVTAENALRQDVRAMLSEKYIAVGLRGKKWAPTTFSREFCETVLNRAADLFDHVRGQTNHPLYWQGQTLSGQIGFHEETGLLITGEEITVKSRTSDEQAKALIDSWTVAIPARSSDDRYRIGLLALSIYAGFTLSHGGRPIFMIRASHPDTGKTWTSQCAIAAVCGHDVETVAWPKKEESRPRVIMSALTHSPSVVLFDNLPNGSKVNDPVLCAYATTNVFSDRLLYDNKLTEIDASVSLPQ